MKRLLIGLLLLAGVVLPASGWAQAHDLFELLDGEIRNSSLYRQKRQERIDTLQGKLRDSISLDDARRFYLLGELVNACCNYDYDLSTHYASAMSELAGRMEDPERIHTARLATARILISGGLFMSALETLDGLDERLLTTEQLSDYYAFYASNYYGFSSFIGHSEHARSYLMQGNVYQEKLVSILPEGSVPHTVARAHLLIHRFQDYEQAARLLRPLCEQADINDREFAKYATTMAMLYGKFGDSENQKRMLAQAAICDIRNAVRENTAIMNLSQLLYAEGNYERAYLYARQAFEDASSYNARHRKIQLSDFMHMIETERLLHEQNSRQRLRTSMIVTTVLALLSLGLLVVVFIQLRKANRRKVIIEQTNLRLNALNVELREANQIKDTYLIDFLVICMDYIDKINSLIFSARKRMKNQAWDELAALLDPMIPHKERQMLAKTFDSIFLSLFPTFVEDVNRLLVEEGKICVRGKESLNNELRIYALMRLGIRDSIHIAKFLDCTVNTIYTYRTNIKSRACDKEAFEQDVMKIGMKINNPKH